MKTIEQILKKIKKDIRFYKKELKASEMAYHFGDEEMKSLDAFEIKFNILNESKRFIEENN